MFKLQQLLVPKVIFLNSLEKGLLFEHVSFEKGYIRIFFKNFIFWVIFRKYEKFEFV